MSADSTLHDINRIIEQSEIIADLRSKNAGLLDRVDALQAALDAEKAHSDRLATRLAVHATPSGGYVNDPESEDTDFPGESERWCVRDQYALAAHRERRADDAR